MRNLNKLKFFKQNDNLLKIQRVDKTNNKRRAA